MADTILIFGKDAWPFTRAAREAFAKAGKPFDYLNVAKVAGHLDRMLKLTNGSRKVPVIVEGQNVTIGFEGKAWAIWFFRLDALGMANDEWRMTNLRIAEWQLMNG